MGHCPVFLCYKCVCGGLGAVKFGLVRMVATEVLHGLVAMFGTSLGLEVKLTPSTLASCMQPRMTVYEILKVALL